MIDPEMITKTKSERKIYSKDDMFSYFYCPKEIPNYLKEFSCILNDNPNDLWCKRTFPKFDEMPDSKHRATYAPNKFKERQRTTSNQSGDIVDPEQNVKYRSQNIHPVPKLRSDKFNRYNLLNESQTNSSTNNEVGGSECDWQTVESKSYKVSNLSKQYVSNYQGQENHWKKWSKDRTLSGDKSSPFIRNEKTNNFVVRKAEVANRQDNPKLHTSQSFSSGPGQTEDIWQDDWETEMQSQIITTAQESLDCYELPPSCIAATNVTEIHCSMTIPSSNNTATTTVESPLSDFDQWFYIDLSNKCQGPFPSESMANWLATGYFDFSTRLRRQCDERFLLLAEYRALYGRIPFTAGATIAPILESTTLDIDPMQLTAGLDIATLQKVLTNATSLSSKVQQFKATNPILPDNDMVVLKDIEKIALLEDKRLLEESKAELEMERKRLIDEQEQWKIRMAVEMEEKMQSLFNLRMMELNKNVFDLSTACATKSSSFSSPNNITKEESVINASESRHSNMLKETVDDHGRSDVTSADKSPMQLKMELSTEDVQSEDWHPMKDNKGSKKNKKSKNKSVKVSSDQETLSTTEVKHIDAEKTSQIVKESGSIRIVQKEVMDEYKQGLKISESQKPESLSWIIKPTVLNIEQPKATKSLLEIQAEETENAKTKHELEKANNLLKAEANKVSSFKESLLKSVGPVKTPIIPSGKSIWDLPVVDSVEIVSPAVVEVQAPPPVRRIEPKNKKKSNQRPSDDYEKHLLSANNSDGLLKWCGVQLSKFNPELDVFTVVELLKQVPSENVPQLTLELLDDSVFSKNFARDFVKKREELSSTIVGPREDTQWQTVKKQNTVTDKSNNGGQVKNTVSGGGGSGGGGGAVGKSKTKKKMIAVDITKFRSC